MENDRKLVLSVKHSIVFRSRFFRHLFESCAGRGRRVFVLRKYT